MRRHVELRSKPVQPVDTGAIFLALQRTHIGAVDFGGVSQSLLRQSFPASKDLQISGKDLAT